MIVPRSIPALLATGIVSLLTIATGDCARPVFGQEDFAESVAINIDATIERRLDNIRQHIAAEQWDDAIRFLNEVLKTHAGQLIQVQNGRYVSVELHVIDVIKGLPPAGLAVWREQVDPTARQWFETATENPETDNSDRLRQVITETPFSNYHDKALLELGNREWQQGHAGMAGYYWQRIENRLANNQAGELSLKRPDLLARLALCDLATQRDDSAHRRLIQLKNEFPDAIGTVAGNKGRLADLVQIELTGWKPDQTSSDSASDSASKFDRQIGPIRGQVWAQVFHPLPPIRRPVSKLYPLLAYAKKPYVFPLLWRDKLFVNDPQSIYAVHAKTGKGLWSEDGLIFQTKVVLPRLALRGSPAFRMSVDKTGRLFARMGSPVTVRSDREPTALRSEIVCLDLANAEGRELWRLNDADFGPDFCIEGSPVVDENRAYLVVTKSDVRTEYFVVCLNADNGDEIWRQQACALLRMKSASTNEVSSLRVDVTDDSVVLPTNQGAIAAFQKKTGRPQWVVTYPSSASNPPTSTPTSVTNAGKLLVCPSDADRIMAIDQMTGAVRWETRLPDQIKHSLGCEGNRWIVSGNSLWGINVDSGKVAWGSPRADPEFYGYGRGIIAGDTVCWPTQKQIEFRNFYDGRMVRKPLNLVTMRQFSGNLLAIDGHLLISSAQAISLLGPVKSLEKRRIDWH